MSVQLPSMPSMPSIPHSTGNDSTDSANNKKYDQDLMKYQEEMARYNRVLQMAQQMQNEKTAKDTNMLKSNHDALMSVANNLKA